MFWLGALPVCVLTSPRQRSVMAPVACAAAYRCAARPAGADVTIKAYGPDRLDLAVHDGSSRARAGTLER